MIKPTSIHASAQKFSKTRNDAGSITSPKRILMPVLAELTPRGDGTYIMKPQAVCSDMDSWISPEKASKIIGIDCRSIYRLLDATQPYLVHKRPLKKKCLISLKSVLSFINATNDPDFWEDSLQQKTLKDSVRDAMEAMRSGDYSQAA